MKMVKKEVIFYVLVIAVITVIKILCAPSLALSGTTGIMAIALFAGLNKTYSIKNSFVLPLVALLVSDAILQVLHVFNMFPFEGFYKGLHLNYLLLLVLTGIGILFRRAGTPGIFISALVGPTIYYFVDNYVVWAGSWQTMGYSHNFAGLMDCYIKALPFYRNSLVSTIVLLPSLVLMYRWIVKGKTNMAFAE
jgi:hypothetical protein